MQRLDLVSFSLTPHPFHWTVGQSSLDASQNLIRFVQEFCQINFTYVLNIIINSNKAWEIILESQRSNHATSK